MKFSKLLSGLLGLLSLNLYATYVTPQTAQIAAQQFLATQVGVKANKLRLHKELTQDNKTSLYIFNWNQNEQKAFVLVAADDIARPILGYSSADTFDYANAPEHVIAWLSDYEKSILWGIQNHIAATEDIKLAWDQLRQNKDLIGKRRGSVAPILKSKWNQLPYFNDMCPLDGSKRSVAGCVATAMAQVIHHWQYPTKGSGFHSYNHSKLGTISANFGNSTYNYSNMPNTVNAKNSDVALLNFHCGVAVEMNYSATSSGAYVINSASPVTHCAEYAIKKYFNYPSTVNGQERDNFTTNAWKSKVNSDIDNGRPIIYAGFGTGGGHAFVFDGYDNSGKYHVNWGWGGAYNGYFEMDALNPDGLGTGGGSGSYNSGHQAIFGVEAPSNTQTDASLSIYANVAISASRITYGQSFSITTNAANISGKDFSGSLAIGVFDDSFNFLEFVGERSNVTLATGYTFNPSLTFQSTGSLSMLPGEYHLYLCYKNNGGDWKIANDYGSYTNYAPLEVYYYSDIELYKELTVVSGRIKKGQTATVSFNVANTGTSVFRGNYAVALYNMDGSFAQLIGNSTDNNGLAVNSTYTNNIQLTSSAITVEPGTYLLALQYQNSGATTWTLAGSYFQVNPIKVIVEEAPIQADPYEVNNDVQSAYKINFTYTNNQSSWNTNISNIHQESDVDYFKIDFDESYQYTLDVKVSDINKTFNGKSYGLDARFSLSDDGVFWSSTFANEMTQSLKVNGANKKYVLVRVVPAFAGLTGDYDLNISISRENTASVETLSPRFNVYPNPSSTRIKVLSNQILENADYEVVSISGAVMLKGHLESNREINIESISAGMYFLNIKSFSDSQCIQFIKE